jgi:hypothetical protein
MGVELMTDSIPSRILEGLSSPRASARRLLDEGHSLGTALLMVALAYLIGSIAQLIIAPETLPDNQSPLGFHVVNGLLSVAWFFILAGMAYGLGKISGGTGTLPQAQVVIAWHSLVCSLLTPIVLPMLTEFAAFQDQLTQAAEAAAEAGQQDLAAIMPDAQFSAFSVLLGLAAGFMMVWLLASYVAEMHGFRNTVGVMGVIVGIPLALAVVLTYLSAVLAAAGG